MEEYEKYILDNFHQFIYMYILFQLHFVLLRVIYIDSSHISIMIKRTQEERK